MLCFSVCVCVCGRFVMTFLKKARGQFEGDGPQYL